MNMIKWLLYTIFVLMFIGLFYEVKAAPFIEENVTSQKYVYTRWKLITDAISSTNTVSEVFDTKFSPGISFQSNVVCDAACSVEIRVFASVNCVDYVAIPDVTLTTTETCNHVQNLSDLYFKCFRIELENTGEGTATINVWASIKEAM